MSLRISEPIAVDQQLNILQPLVLYSGTAGILKIHVFLVFSEPIAVDAQTAHSLLGNQDSDTAGMLKIHVSLVRFRSCIPPFLPLTVLQTS